MAVPTVLIHAFFRLSMTLVSFIYSLNTIAASLHAAVLPTLESDRKRKTNGYFATLINDTDQIANNCRIEIDGEHKLNIRYWSSHQADNSPAGIPGMSVDIPPRKSQSFVFKLSPYAKPVRTSGSVFPTFICDDHEPAVPIANVNDIKLQDFDFSEPYPLTEEEWIKLQKIMRKMEVHGWGDVPILSESERALLKRWPGNSDGL